MDYSHVTVDILQNDKYMGAIENVRFITDSIDSAFGMAITLVAFLIILVAMFRNVLAAAYCAYPRFWQEVHSAHEEAKGNTWASSLGELIKINNWSNDSLSHMVLRILPDIMGMTEFGDKKVSAKSYWLRAIPQMLGCIIIGAFIYNGYYRTAAAEVVDFGSAMVENVLLEADPLAMFYKFTRSSGRPTFASDNSEIPKQQIVNSLATSMYSRIIGEYTDISGSAAKSALAANIEAKANTFIDEIEAKDSAFVDGKSWKVKVSTTITYGQVTATEMASDANNTTYQFTQNYAISDFGFDTNINVNQPMYLRVTITLTKQVVASGSHNVTDLVLHLPVRFSKEGTFPSSTALVPNSTKSGNAISASTEQGGTATITISADTSDASRTLKISLDTGNRGTLDLDTPITLNDLTNHTTHSIQTIMFDATGNTWYLSSASEGRDNITFDTTDLGVSAK